LLKWYQNTNPNVQALIETLKEQNPFIDFISNLAKVEPLHLPAVSLPPKFEGKVGAIFVTVQATFAVHR